MREVNIGILHLFDPNTPIRLSSEFPSILQDIVSNSEWTRFRDAVNTALKPAEELKQETVKWLPRILMLIFLIGIAITIGGRYGVPTEAIVFPGLFVGGAALFCYYRKFMGKFTTIMEQVQNVCQLETNKRRNVASFNVHPSVAELNILDLSIRCNVLSSATATPSAMEEGGFNVQPTTTTQSSIPHATVVSINSTPIAPTSISTVPVASSITTPTAPTTSFAPTAPTVSTTTTTTTAPTASGSTFDSLMNELKNK